MQSAPPRRRKAARRTGWVALALFIAAFGLYALWEYVPYQSAAARQVRNALAGFGLHDVSLKVERANSARATLADIRLGKEPPLTLAHLTAEYDLADLREGRIHAIGSENLELTAYATPEGWRIGGLEPLLAAKEKAQGTPALPFDAEALRAALPERIALKNAVLHLRGDGFTADITLEEATYSAAPKPILLLRGKAISGESGKYRFAAHAFSLEAALENGVWACGLRAESLTVDGLPQPIPSLTAQGKCAIDKEKAAATLALADAKGDYAADLSLNLPLASPAAAMLALKRVAFPWEGGVVSASAPRITPGDPVRVTLHLDKVDVSRLLSEASSGQVQATGKISGELPFTWRPDGTIILHEGTLQALEAGTLIVAPDTLGQGEQGGLALARAALRNFHYASLKIGVSSDAKGSSVLRLTVEGESPDAAEFTQGRSLKLNIAVTGDVVSLLRQSLLPLQNPAQLLREQKDNK